MKGATKIVEIIPDNMPEWALNAMDRGQFFKEALEKISTLESAIAKQESDSDIIDWIIANRPSFSTTLKAMYVSKTGERYQGKDLRDAVKQAIKKQNT